MPRFSTNWIAWACVAAATSSTDLAAQKIWRCANNSYSDIPCTDGASGGTSLDAPPSPSAEQRQSADDATRRNQAAAERMKRERLRLESQRPRQAVIIDSARTGRTKTAASADDKKEEKIQRPKKPDGFTASYSDPSAPKPTRKKPSRTE